MRNSPMGLLAPVLALAVAFVLVPAELGATSMVPVSDLELQSLVVHDVPLVAPVRDTYTVKAAPRPPRAASNPSGAQAIALGMMPAYGWDAGQFDCLVALWNRESGWNAGASNPSSGAHGIPQALPGSKMASAGADWATNPATQIKWGLGYVAGRYGTPCVAWQHSESVGWY